MIAGASSSKPIFLDEENEDDHTYQSRASQSSRRSSKHALKASVAALTVSRSALSAAAFSHSIAISSKRQLVTVANRSANKSAASRDPRPVVEHAHGAT